MADNNIEIKIHLEEGGSTATLKNFKDEVIKSGVSLRDLRGQLGNFIVHSKKMSASVKLTGKELKNLEKTVGGFKTATGGATAAAMELGRVVSDAPYGIRGMANNVSQLASQITYMANATDKATGKSVGFVGAIKNVGRSLMGTTGVLLAIQAVIAAIDYFANRTDNSTESLGNLNEELDKTISKLDILSGKLDFLDDIDLFSKLGLSNEEDAENIKKFSDNMKETLAVLNSEFPEFKKAYENLSKTQRKDPSVIGNLISQYRKLIDTRREINNQEAVLQDLKGKTGEYAEDNLQRATETYKQLLLQKIQLEEIFKVRKKNNKKETLIKEPKSKLKETLNKEAEITREHLQELLLMQEEDQIKRAKLKVKFDIENAEREKEIALKDFEFLANKYNKELELYLNQQVKLGKITREQADKRIKEEANKSSEMLNQLRQIYDSRISYLKAVGNEEISQAVNKEALKSSKQIQEIQKYLDKKVQLHEKELQLDMSFYNKQEAIANGAKKVADTKAKAMQGYIEALRVALDGISSFIQSEADREVTAVENKNNALNEELNNRLLNENLSVKERKRIQNEIARNDEEARKKQNAIKKKAFEAQKAFNIANAVINTYAGATRALSDYPAPASYVLAAATIASGLLQVATISRQKFQPEAASTPIRTSGGGGGGGGVGNRTFDFNLVGSSQGNQVAEAVQGQFDKPIKAYVVSKDITNQQQLDANTKSSAKFGG